MSVWALRHCRTHALLPARRPAHLLACRAKTTMAHCPNARGTACGDLQTPALLLDLPAFERNCARIARLLARTPKVAIRPHAKAHKSAAVAAMQLRALRDAGANVSGVCAQTIAEAESMAMAGTEDAPIDVFLSNQTLGQAKVARLARLSADKRVVLSACFDDLTNAAMVNDAVGAVGGKLAAVVEADVGQARCGTPTAEAAAALAKAIADGMPHLTFRGVHVYHGGIQHVRTVADRRAAAEKAHVRARAVVDACAAAGVPTESYVTGGGSGTFPFEQDTGFYTEVQPGSYFFGDCDYGANEVPPDESNEQSMWVLTTVISAQPGCDWVVVDAGAKAVSTDCGPPQVYRDPESAAALSYACAGDEHGILRASESGAPLPKLGETLWLRPGHVDPTTNLHTHWVIVRDGTVADVADVDARGAGI